MEETEEKIIDLATASQTIAELQAEIEILKGLEANRKGITTWGV